MARPNKRVKALYPHPFPDFELEPQKWLGVSFGAGQIKGSSHDVPLVSFVFADHEYAAKIYDLVLSWIGAEHAEMLSGVHADKKKCIRVAVIEDTESSYIFFCHPNFGNPSADGFYKTVEESSRDEGVVPEREATMLYLGKRCEIGRGSSSRYRWFRDRHRPGVPVALEFLVPDANGSLEMAKATRPIIVFDVLLSKKKDLQEDDPLYTLIKLGPFDAPRDPGNMVN